MWFGHVRADPTQRTARGLSAVQNGESTTELNGGSSGQSHVGLASPAGAPVAIAAGDMASPVFVPVLNFFGEDEICDTWMGVQNVGTQPTIAVFVARTTPSDPAKGPVGVSCSGLLRPGSSWIFLMAQVPVGSNSGAFYSFSAVRMADIGVKDHADDLVGNRLCTVLGRDVVNSPTRYAEFAASYAAGGDFAGIPLRLAMGAPLAVQVVRSCPGSLNVFGHETSAYEGLAGNALGQSDADKRWHYAVQAVAGSFLYVQNAGQGTAEIVAEVRADDACIPPAKCKNLALEPGESGLVALKACTAAGWHGQVLLHASQPVAVVAEDAFGDAVSAHTATPLLAPASLEPLPPSAGIRLAAPLVFSHSKDSEPQLDVAIQNLSSQASAHVRIQLFDERGQSRDVEEATLCPLGSHRLSPVFGMPPIGPDAGRLVVVESLPEGIAAAVPIVAVATMRQVSAGSAHQPISASDVNLTPLVRRDRGSTPTWAGASLLAVPSSLKAGGLIGFSTQVAISQPSADAGMTHAAVLLYDQNALRYTLCRAIGPQSTVIVDLDQVPDPPEGFMGSALIRADNSGDAQATRTGLLATVRDIQDPAQSVDDHVGAYAALPVPESYAVAFEGLGSGALLCLGDNRPAIPPHPTPVPVAPLGPAGDAEVHLPIVAELGETPISATLSVRNLGQTPTKLLLVAWAESWFCPPDCRGPLALSCSGLLAAGATWHFPFDGTMAAATSATVFSLAVDAPIANASGWAVGHSGLSTHASGPSVHASESASQPNPDPLCATLQAAIEGKCDAISQFEAAFRNGGSFEGLQVDRSIGPPIEAVVERTIPPGARVDSMGTAHYTGIPHAATLRPGFGADPGAGKFVYHFADARVRVQGSSDIANIQNVGLGCLSAVIEYQRQGEQKVAFTCPLFTLAPGESFSFDLGDCLSGAFTGKVTIRSSQPLAIVVDEVRVDAFSTRPARPGVPPASTLALPIGFKNARLPR